MKSHKYIYIIIFLSVISLNAQNYDVGGRLRIGFVDYGTMAINPFAYNTDYEREISQLIFGDGLFTRAPDGHTIHGLASSSTTNDPETWLFNIKSDVYFHNGNRVTAEDVKFSYELYKKFALQSPQLYKMRLIKKIEITNPQRLKIQFEKPVTDFSETIGQLPVLSKRDYISWLNYDSVRQLPNIRPVGMGYFQYDGLSNSNTIRLNYYPGHFEGRPYLNGIEINLYETHEQLLDAFLREKIDLIKVQDKSVLQKIYQFMPSREHIFSIDEETLNLYYINFNTKKDPFNNINIRKAVNFSINRQQFVNKIVEDGGSVSYSIYQSSSKYYYEMAEQYAYNPFSGLEILRAAGYRKNSEGKLAKNNQELKFELLFEKGSQLQESMVRIISINLAEIGIIVNPRPVLPKMISEIKDSGDYEAILQKFSYSKQEPEQAVRDFYLNFINNENGYQNFRSRTIDQYIKLSEEAVSEREMLQLIQQIQNIFYTYAPCVFIFFEDRVYYAVNMRFQNFKNSHYNDLKFVVKLNSKNVWFVPEEKQKF